jgi:hypothetical protein
LPGRYTTNSVDVDVHLVELDVREVDHVLLSKGELKTP